MKRRLPPKHNGHKICIICEGDEEYDYLTRLKELQVWNKQYLVKIKNAGSIDNISAMYQNEYSNDNYEIVLIFCDTEITPYDQYERLKQSLTSLFGTLKAAKSIIFFANPCTMQIVLLHFGAIALKSNQKNKNSAIIKKLTSVEEYRAEKRQRDTIMKKITVDNYAVLKKNIAAISKDDKRIPSTNFLKLLNYLESADTAWINTIEKIISNTGK